MRQSVNYVHEIFKTGRKNKRVILCFVHGAVCGITGIFETTDGEKQGFHVPKTKYNQ